MIDIKDIQGKTIVSVPFNAGSLHRKKLMSEDCLLLKFNTVAPVQLGRGCYAEYNGVQYELIDFVFPSQNTSTGGYDYELRLDAYYWKWKNKILMYDRQGSNRETSWKLTQGPEAHMDIICSNLATLGYSYNGTPFTHNVDPSIKDLVKLVSYEGTNIIDALATIAETWEMEWWVENSIINLGKCEYNTALNFELGTNVQSMARSESNDNFATRIYAFGSTRNLPANYRENSGIVVGGVVQKRLMMPAGTPYVDAWPGLKQEEATEAVVVFDDVYPRRIGKISSVTIKTGNIVDENDQPTGETYPIYTIKDNDLKNFEEKDLLDDLRLVFSSGSLNGMDFGLKLQSSDKTGTSFEINRNEDYGVFLPNESLKPNEGDEYILYGFDISHIPGDYVPAAEDELKQRAEKYVEKSKEDPSVYDCEMNAVWLTENKVDLNVGNRVHLINPAYFDDGRQSRIYGFEKHLDGSQVKYTVGNSAKYSRLAQVENEIKEIIYQGNAYSGSGGGVYVIGRYDKTAGTDRNVFSALRSALEYVSKKYDDVVRGIITFAKGIRFGQFVKGSSGAGVYQDDDGNWHIEGDYGHFRKKLTATEVEIQKTSHIGGKQISTGAEMVCSRVEEYDNFWRCYFVKEDDAGNEIFNQFKEEDLAYVETFNLVKQANGYVGNHFYWRKVTGTGNDYIDLSKSLCAAESDAPLVGDNIIQLGHAGSDTTRQGAIIQASAGLASPYYRIYSGIKTFTLPEPDVTLSPHGTKIKAESIILEASGEKLNTYLDDLVADMKAVKKQADGMWVLWFAEEQPTPYNYPAIEWDTDEVRDMHLQDIAVIDNPSDDRNNGRAWRFHKSEDGEYSWTEITDKYLLDALGIAVEGRNIAKEKCRNFVVQPTDTDEYEIGDTWSNATWLNADGTYLYDNDNLVATSGKTAGKPFSISHWQPVNNASTARLKLMEDEILLAVAPSVEAAQSLADKAEKDAFAAAEEARKALGIANDAEGLATTNSQSLSSMRQTMESISATVGKIKFNGNDITNISKSGLVTTANFTSILSDSVTIKDGKVVNIDKSGILTEAQGNTLWASKKMENGKEIISSINQTAESVSINANKINLNGAITINSFSDDLNKSFTGKANSSDLGDLAGKNKADLGLGDLAFKNKVDQAMLGETIIQGGYIRTDLIQTDGLNVKNAELSNVKITGSIRSPFVRYYEMWIIGENNPRGPYYDNLVFAIDSNYSNKQLNLAWDVNCSGRRFTIINYKWGSSISNDKVVAIAPDGKYFYENGAQHKKISIAREVVELLGYGDNNTFFGWIVMRRLDIMPTHAYGKNLKILAQGLITSTNEKASIQTLVTFDNHTLTVTRMDVGKYRISIPSEWGLIGGMYIVMLTGYKYAYGNNKYPIKATVVKTESTYFDVETSDDQSNNDGSFFFQITNMYDWIKII